MRGLLALRVATAAAVAGLRRDCEEALAAAERAAAQRDPRLDPDWLYWFDDAHFAALTGRCLAALGRPAAARALLESAMRSKALRFRAAGITGAALATARLGTGDVDAACAAATDALVACVQSGSVRAANALRAFDRAAAAAPHRPAGDRPRCGTMRGWWRRRALPAHRAWRTGSAACRSRPADPSGSTHVDLARCTTGAPADGRHRPG